MKNQKGFKKESTERDKGMKIPIFSPFESFSVVYCLKVGTTDIDRGG
jgi:hypothetical protein